VKPGVTGNWLQFRRFCTLNNFIISIIDYLGWIFFFAVTCSVSIHDERLQGIKREMMEKR
jgi:hypothetical protein